MYNTLDKYLTANNILFSKQLGFWASPLTNHVLAELVKEINNGFIESKYRLGMFFDLSKTFDTVDHSILQSKVT